MKGKAWGLDEKWKFLSSFQKHQKFEKFFSLPTLNTLHNDDEEYEIYPQKQRT